MEIDRKVLSEIKTLVFNGFKLYAVVLLKKHTQCGLREAKEFVDNLQEKHTEYLNKKLKKLCNKYEYTYYERNY